MSGNKNLSELIAEAQAGSDRAIEDVLQQAARLAFARFLRTLGSAEPAEDLTQDVLVAVLKGLSGLRDPNAFLPWLRAIVDGTAADYFGRNQKRMLCHESIVDRPALPDAHALPERLEEHRRLRKGLAALEPRNRLAIELFYFRDLTCKQVAEFLAISHDAARAAISRSRRELKRRLSEVSIPQQAKGKTYTYVVEVRSSEECTFRGGPFQQDVHAQELYMALYPGGDVAAAARNAKVPPESVHGKVEFLQEMRLIVPHDSAWRCTMPVVNAADAELMRPWAEPIVNALVAGLGPLREQLARLSQLVSGELAQQTVMAVGLLAEAARRPFDAVREQSRASAPERGRFGRFCTAAFTFQPVQQALCGIHMGEWDGARCYFLWPTQTRRGGIEQLVRDFQSPPGKAPIEDALVDRLARHGLEPLTAQVRSLICDELVIPHDRRAEFWQRLDELHAVAVRDGEMRIALPRIPMAEWSAFTTHLDQLGREIRERVADAADDLRKRAAVSSFADCFFADAVFAFFILLQWMATEEISRRHWVQLPGEADFSWGTLVVA